MTERDIEAEFATIIATIEDEAPENAKELALSIGKVLCQFFVDINRIATAAEHSAIYSEGNSK